MGNVFSKRTFFEVLDRDERLSAERLLRRALVAMRPASVLEVGCGRGVWLAEWMARGVPTTAGLDMPGVQGAGYLIDRDAYQSHDLATPIDLGRRFALVQSFETAQTLAPSAAETFIDTLCRHGDVVLFSSAVPGQGGTDHRNEKPLEYWRGLFEDRGFAAFDPVRPQIQGVNDIIRAHRYNILMYANEAGSRRLPLEIAATRIPETERIPAIGDPLWLARRSALRFLPRSLVSRGAALKNALLEQRARRAATG